MITASSVRASTIDRCIPVAWSRPCVAASASVTRSEHQPCADLTATRGIARGRTVALIRHSDGFRPRTSWYFFFERSLCVVADACSTDREPTPTKAVSCCTCACHGPERERGFLILAFPSNDFRGKEPGTAAEIGAFCRSRYGVTFPLFDKVNTIDPDASPLYRFLAKKHGPPQWNFHKYLIGKDGQVLQAFKSELTPDTPAIHSAIEAALSAP